MNLPKLSLGFSIAPTLRSCVSSALQGYALRLISALHPNLPFQFQWSTLRTSIHSFAAMARFFSIRHVNNALNWNHCIATGDSHKCWQQQLHCRREGLHTRTEQPKWNTRKWSNKRNNPQISNKKAVHNKKTSKMHEFHLNTRNVHTTPTETTNH